MEFIFWFVLVSIFVFGLIIGSFLNCLIWRFGAGESAMRGRSHCPKCRHKLAWFDLVPMLSFLALGGLCRYCKKPISWQYPAVELATAVLFCAMAWAFAPMIFFGFFPFFAILELVSYWVIMATLIVIFVADLRWYLIPDGAVVFGLIGAVGLMLAKFFENNYYLGRFDVEIVVNPFLAGFLAGLFFLVIFLGSRGRWMGFGDVKFAVFMGLVLGFPAILIGLFLANFFGAIIGLGLIVVGKKKMGSLIPFGPFLVFGMLASMFFANQIIGWYLSIGIR